MRKKRSEKPATVSYTHLDVYKRQEEKRADQENDTEEQSTEAKSLLKKKLQYYSSEIQRDVGNLVKWLMICLLYTSPGVCLKHVLRWK